MMCADHIQSLGHFSGVSEIAWLLFRCLLCWHWIALTGRNRCVVFWLYIFGWATQVKTNTSDSVVSVAAGASEAGYFLSLTASACCSGMCPSLKDFSLLVSVVQVGPRLWHCRTGSTLSFQCQVCQFALSMLCLVLTFDWHLSPKHGL